MFRGFSSSVFMKVRMMSIEVSMLLVKGHQASEQIFCPYHDSYPGSRVTSASYSSVS